MKALDTLVDLEDDLVDVEPGPRLHPHRRVLDLHLVVRAVGVFDLLQLLVHVRAAHRAACKRQQSSVWLYGQVRWLWVFPQVVI